LFPQFRAVSADDEPRVRLVIMRTLSTTALVVPSTRP